MEASVSPRLHAHLASWLGRWPSSNGYLDVVGSPNREQPGWDGKVHPAIGVRSDLDGGVLSVPTRGIPSVRALTGRRLDDILAALPAAVGRPDGESYLGIFRWSDAPAALPEAGEWIPADHPAVPGWLRVFTPEVLVALDPQTGAYLAGVGIKRHDRYGHELAVGTAPAARQRGLAKRLVAQAARRVRDEGAIPTYIHDPANTASAHTADAAGFPDRGWTVLAVG
jgi:GNAT superfamily N-acetyltransferase